MTIDEITFEAMRNIYVKINDNHVPVEEVSTNELKNTSYIQIFIQKIISVVNKNLFDKSKHIFVTKKEENA